MAMNKSYDMFAEYERLGPVSQKNAFRNGDHFYEEIGSPAQFVGETLNNSENVLPNRDQADGVNESGSSIQSIPINL